MKGSYEEEIEKLKVSENYLKVILCQYFTCSQEVVLSGQKEHNFNPSNVPSLSKYLLNLWPFQNLSMIETTNDDNGWT